MPDGTPIPPDAREYTAVTADFAYEGGDGYTMLDNGTGTTREPMLNILAQAVRDRGPAAARVEGRIRADARE